MTAKPADVSVYHGSSPVTPGPGPVPGSATGLLGTGYPGRPVAPPPVGTPGAAGPAPSGPGLTPAGPVESTLYGPSIYAAAAAAAQAYLPAFAAASPETSAFFPHHVVSDNC